MSRGVGKRLDHLERSLPRQQVPDEPVRLTAIERARLLIRLYRRTVRGDRGEPPAPQGAGTPAPATGRPDMLPPELADLDLVLQPR
jgi:hypothetical protein